MDINIENNQLHVIKRDGSKEVVSFDKVTNRLQKLADMEPKLSKINIHEIAQIVVSMIYDGVKTYELDDLAAEQCTHKSVQHIQYQHLASRIAISNNQKKTSPSFSETVDLIYKKSNSNLISKDVYEFIMDNKTKINNSIDYSRDFNFDFFSLKTLEKAYLISIDNQVVERIQHMIMRVSIGLYSNNLKKALETYNYMSLKYFTHATPTLFHSGSNNPQLLSCFLLGIDDNVTSIYKSVSDCAQISKWAGGIGVHIHDIRCENSLIHSTNGKSNGIVPMLKVFNDVARHINQSGKRNGSFAMYIEPWHKDIIGFLECKKNHGDENCRARDLFYGLWIPDLFMKRIKNNEEWTLMCPSICQDLSSLYGEDFENKYIYYEKQYPEFTRIKAQKLWSIILSSQMETGTPYLCYKDASNLKSNQKNIGTIKSSNLCTEIIEYSDSKEYACCTLASICLPKFVESFDYTSIKDIKIYTKSNCKFCVFSKKYLKNNLLSFTEILLDDDDKRSQTVKELSSNLNKEIKTLPQIFINGNHIGGFDDLIVYFKPKFNFKKLEEIVSILVYNLNRVIDINYYPIPETKVSNMRHRPIGIGVQGLADVYSLCKVSFDSEFATVLNKQIFACIYYSACKTSMEMSKIREIKMEELKKQIRNQSIPQYYDPELSLSRGNKLYHELMPTLDEIERDSHLGSYSTFKNSPISKGLFQFDLWNTKPLTEVPECKLDWSSLRNSISKYGIRNSLLLAPMPTASTSQIMGNNECIEPITSNIYSRSTLAGDFIIVNKYLQKDLIDIGVWDSDTKDKIILDNGSIQNISTIPDVIKKIYKTSWDLSMKSLINQSADRGIYICQSQSLNLWIENPTNNKLSSMHFYAWEKGLKTGIYYLRRKSVAKAQTFSIDPQKKLTESLKQQKEINSSENECTMCSA